MGDRTIAGLSALVTPSIGAVPGAAVGRIGPAPTVSHVVTVGNDPTFTFFGFGSADAFGAVDPTTANGVMITRLYLDVNLGRWEVSVGQTGLPLTWFTSIEFEVTGGTEFYLAANADTHGDDGTDTLWTFDTFSLDWLDAVGEDRTVNWVFP